jgi:hypothetical protein
MFWPIKKNKKNKKRAAERASNRRLFMEPLEDRRVLAGIVDVQIWPDIGLGDLKLVGENGNEQIEISMISNADRSYEIKGLNGTQLSLNGGGMTFTSLPVNAIFGDITIELGTGNDTFNFVGSSESIIPNDLIINNDDGSNVNILDEVRINGDLLVTKLLGTTGYSELQIRNSTVIGLTVVDNKGGDGLTGGETFTEIVNSWLQGDSGRGAALDLDNPDEKDIISISGNSQFGVGPFPFPIVQAVVDINNRDGGSRTTFTGASPVAGFGTTTVYGDVRISNALNLPGTLDMVTFNGANVLGDVDIVNGDGNTRTMVTNSVLGSHLVADPFSPEIGSPLVIQAERGFDETSLTDTEVPWGCKFEYDVGNHGESGFGNKSDFGSKTDLSQSKCGTHPFGPDIEPLPGVGLAVMGDDGDDVFNMSASEVGETLRLNLFAGNNEVNILNQSVVGALWLQTLGGNDNVLIDDSEIQVAIEATLGSGADSFYVTNVEPAEWPSTLLGAVRIVGGLGVDTTNIPLENLGVNLLLGFENTLQPPI